MMQRLSTNGLVTVGVLLGIALVLVNAALQALWDEATIRDDDAATLDELVDELAAGPDMTPATSAPATAKSTRKAEGQKAG